MITWPCNNSQFKIGVQLQVVFSPPPTRQSLKSFAQLYPGQNKMATRTSLATDFPLRNPRNRPGKTVLLHICGFAMTVDELLHWADTHNIEPNAPFFKRLDVTRREILDRLPWKIEGPYACLFVDHETEKLTDGLPRPATCFFVGTNGSQKALDQAKNEDLIRGFQEVLDTQEKPRWYRPNPF
ncbi:uncharacterized protein ARMOST_15691 [Armillaria ostoyae]|uniref:Uncharacterized protein n=1 Tax=Armillaria ostoyae TaxID=47428 RepID=A0A284RU17_ARMOS|nr:uncharacterized protein ARMOST_15691 [Armillaria ostoyae]